MTDQEPRPHSAPDPLNLVGTVLAGRYRVLEVLGRGAMGTVYLSEHIKIGRKTALKILNAADHDPGSVARFARGAQNAARIDHPNVCRVFDFGDPPGGLQFLAMEFVEGESLFDILRAEGTLSPERAVSIVAQTANALQAAHDLGIVHRDLKPANIMITRAPDGSELVKVVDFDIAKEMTQQQEEEEVTTHGWLVGTPEYMSPEQFMGGSLDGRSDVYSLGIILFRLLTGQFPHTSTTPRDIMMERLSAEPRTLQEAAGKTFPTGLQSAIEGAMRIAPDERWPTASRFGQAVLQSHGVPAAQPGEPTASAAGFSGAPGPAPRGASPPPPNARGEPGPQRVPATMVSRETPSPATLGSGRPATGGRGRAPRALQVTVAVLAVVTAGLVTRALMAPDPDVSTSRDNEAASPGGGGAAPDSVALLSGRGDGSGASAGGTRPAGPGTSTSGDPTPPPPRLEPGGPAASRTLTTEEARRILTGFEDRFVALVLVGVPDSVAARAAEEATRIFREFERRGEAPVQSQAAFVLSKAMYYRGRSADALEWARRAWDLEPVESRRLWLARLQGSPPGPESPR